MAIEDWSTNPANNTLVGAINWSEGQLPGTVNGSARQMMADVAVWRNLLASSASTYALATGQIFSGRVGRDVNFYLDLLSSNPVLNFDANDFLQYDRVNDALVLSLGGNVRFRLRQTGDMEVFGAGSFRYNSSTIWTQANDGSGSGLDADLLDGQEGTFYANIPARLGYTPANVAGDTFTGPIRRDSAFYLDMLSGSPIANFDANDYILYDRVNNKYNFIIGGVVQASIDGTGTLRTRGNVIGNTTP